MLASFHDNLRLRLFVAGYFLNKLLIFVTGLMVVYGDIVPRRASARERGIRTIN